MLTNIRRTKGWKAGVIQWLWFGYFIHISEVFKMLLSKSLRNWGIYCEYQWVAIENKLNMYLHVTY